MPTAAQKYSEAQRRERLKARYAAKAGSQVTFDEKANAERKRQLCTFWRENSAQFTRWWRTHSDRVTAILAATAPTMHFTRLLFSSSWTKTPDPR